MNKAGETGGAAGGVPPVKPEDTPVPKADDKTLEKDGDDEFDELGYKKTPAPGAPQGDKKQVGDKQKEDPAEEPKKVEPGTGYGDKPPVVEDPPEDLPPKDPPPPPTDLDKKLEGLNEHFAKKVKEQITDIGLEGEKLDKFIVHKKKEQADAQAWTQAQEAEMKRQDALRKQQWDKELREDPAFGKDKFQVNVARADKILDEYGGELKKELTDAKQMLRPSVMRMLARLADQLYPDRQLVHGEPPVSRKKEDDDASEDPLAFYQ